MEIVYRLKLEEGEWDHFLKTHPSFQHLAESSQEDVGNLSEEELDVDVHDLVNKRCAKIEDEKEKKPRGRKKKFSVEEATDGFIKNRQYDSNDREFSFNLGNKNSKLLRNWIEKDQDLRNLDPGVKITPGNTLTYDVTKFNIPGQTTMKRDMRWPELEQIARRK